MKTEPSRCRLMPVRLTLHTPARLRALLLGTALLLGAFGAHPVAAQAPFIEDFSSNTLPPGFERSGGVGETCCGNQVGGSVFENGHMRFLGEDTRGDGSGYLRSYLRTMASDYSSVDFTAEVTVTIPPNQGLPNVGRNIVFFGLGSADIDQSPGSGIPNWQGIHLWVQPSNFAPQIVGVDGTGSDGNPSFLQDIQCGGDGTYRLRMERSASTKRMVLSVQTNYAGGPFVADCTLPPIDGSNNGFNASNARIYIGGDWNATFDDLRVFTSSSPGSIYVGSWRHGVAKYNTATGAPHNVNFIDSAVLGSNVDPYALLLWDNILFVGDEAANRVGTYNATTGAAINPNFITGLTGPRSLARVGNTLYVAHGNTVGTYNATTGAAINPGFITGLNGVTGIAISGGTLYATSQGGNSVRTYNATTGAAINASFITGLASPQGIAVFNNNVYVANWTTGNVGKYDATTGAAINANFITGLSGPIPLVIFGNVLYVLNYQSRTLGKYDPTTGAAINSSFITGLVGGADGLAIGYDYVLLPAPKISVEQPAGAGLVDGAASIDFGTLGLGSSSVPNTFTIRNSGTANLTGLAITKDGANAGDFAVSVLGATTLAPGASTTFTVTFTPGAGGARSAAIHIASNDYDEHPFDINLSGSRIAPLGGGYDVGAIPDFTVRNDTLLEFGLYNTGGGPFTMAVSGGPPAGAVTFNASTALFRYVPAATDNRPFTVTFTSASGVSNSFTITPDPILPPEYTVFGTDERTQLSNSVAGDLIKEERPSYFPTNFNYGMRTTYSASLISGGTNVIQQGHPNNLYETFFTNRSDITQMELMAETLIIRSPLFLRQTHVVINARHLRFEGSGKIITTPQELTVPALDATATNAPGGNGTNGLPGGSVDVFVETFTDATGNAAPKFVLTGGKGQAAGRGRHGLRGNDAAQAVSAHTRTLSCTFGSDSTRTAVPPEGHLITYVNDGAGYTAAWPEDGTAAWQPGIPGIGGNAGVLRSSYAPLLHTVSTVGGSPGLPGSALANATSSRTDLCVGGPGGYPRLSAHVSFWSCGGTFQCVLCWGVSALHTNLDGRSFSVPTSSPGAPGSGSLVGTGYSWLNPQLLRKIINDAKDDYLQNRITAAQSRLANYAQLVEQYRSDGPAWNAGEQMARFELSQMYDEMRILLQQIANGLDYFGNPNGWVPMLSFEVAADIFDEEIDRSLDIVYLAKWITQKQANAQETFNALTTARTKLADEIEEAKTRYATAADELAGLQGEAAELSQRVRGLQNELEARENTLHQEAVANSRTPDWEVGLRVALKTAATICQMVPVYQPALGAVGGALDLASNSDPDRPWDTLTGALDLTTRYTQSGIQAAAEQQRTAAAGTQSAALTAANARIAALGNLGQASAALSSGIKDMSSYLEQSKAPSSKIEAELERLRSADPQYGALVKDIRQLMVDKRQFADKIISGIHEVASLSDLITRDILAIDGLSVSIGGNANLINGRVSAYLKDMERRAFDRLLKYHYLMAKAYEYRLVTPYNATLNLEDLYNNISDLANANTTPSGALTDGQRDVLKGVFKNVIAETTQRIIPCSAKFMADFGLWEPSQRVIQGYFHSIVSAEAVRSSGYHSNLVIQTLDRAVGNLSFGFEPVQQKWLVRAQHPGDLFHRLDPTAHRPGAPVI